MSFQLSPGDLDASHASKWDAGAPLCFEFVKTVVHSRVFARPSKGAETLRAPREDQQKHHRRKSDLTGAPHTAVGLRAPRGEALSCQTSSSKMAPTSVVFRRPFGIRVWCASRPAECAGRADGHADARLRARRGARRAVKGGTRRFTRNSWTCWANGSFALRPRAPRRRDRSDARTVIRALSVAVVHREAAGAPASAGFLRLPGSL